MLGTHLPPQSPAPPWRLRGSGGFLGVMTQYSGPRRRPEQGQPRGSPKFTPWCWGGVRPEDRGSHTACTPGSPAQQQLGRPPAQVSISHTSGCHLLAVEGEARGKHGRSAGAVAVASESAQGWPSVVPWGPVDSLGQRCGLWSRSASWWSLSLTPTGRYLPSLLGKLP